MFLELIKEIYNKINRGRSNIFIQLNEKDRFNNNLKETKCHFPNCKKTPIESHTYPKSMLKKFANSNNVYSINLSKLVGASYSDRKTPILEIMNIGHSGVKPLFCKFHDTEIFKRIELKNIGVDEKTFLCLFLYRVFCYDYLLEKEIKLADNRGEILGEKDYSKKITKEDEKKYFMEQKVVQFILNGQYSFDIYKNLKSLFDEIFNCNSEPVFKDFQNKFHLKFYEIRNSSNFLACGCQFYYAPTYKNSTIPKLPSIYALVPNKKGDAVYFAILIPNDEKHNMIPLIECLDNKYKEYENNQSNSFIKIVEFLLLESSQNIIMTEKLYNSLSEEEKEIFEKVYYYLVIARLFGGEESKCIKDEAYRLLTEISLIAD